MADKPKEQIDTAPDPDEDDLDDLDDVLDQFNAQPKPATPAPPPPQSSSKPPPSAPHHDALPKDDELAAQLQAGMQDLMGELDSNPEMQREFERMMAELVQAGQASSDAEAIEHIGKATEAVNLGGEGAAGSSSSTAGGGAGGDASGSKKSGGSSSSSTGQPQESFQDTIRKTMERMQASGASASAAAASSSSTSAEDDMMAQLMKELQSGGGGGEEDFNKMLMGMMAQLTNKEILYEPMKELHDKFPAWMEKNKGSTGKEDLARFEEQQVLVGDIVGRFERKGYSDENEDDREYIVERMQKMQAAGSPPPDLVGDMSSAQEALGDLEGGCPTQ